MDIKELLTMQKSFDRYLAAKQIGQSDNEKLDEWNRSVLDKKLLALSVEVGGAWRNVAMESIKEYLKARLEGLDNVKIIS